MNNLGSLGNLTLGGAKTSSFTPKGITSLLLWYDLSDTNTVTVTGAGISQILDKSGNSWTLSQGTDANRLPYTAGAINGLHAATGDGSTILVANSTATTHGIGTNDFTYTAVVRKGTSTGQYLAPGAFGQVNPGFMFRGPNASTNKMSIFDTTDRVFDTTLSASTLYIITMMRSSGVAIAYINGVQEATTPAYTDSIPDAVFRLGSGQSAANPWDSHIGEVTLYTKALSTAELANLHSYLNAKWDIY